MRFAVLIQPPNHCKRSSVPGSCGFAEAGSPECPASSPSNATKKFADFLLDLESVVGD